MNAAGIQKWIDATHTSGPVHTARWMAMAVDLAATFLYWISSIEEAREAGTEDTQERADIFYEAMMSKCTTLMETEKIDPEAAESIQEHVNFLITADNKLTDKKIETIKILRFPEPNNN